METTTLRGKMIKNLIKASKGTFLTICFIKQDGTERVMNGRIEVWKGHVDPENVNLPTTAHIPKYVVLWDNNAPCKPCKGTGEVEADVETDDIPDEAEVEKVKCPKCKGTGKGWYRNANVETAKWIKVKGITLKAHPDVEVN